MQSERNTLENQNLNISVLHLGCSDDAFGTTPAKGTSVMIGTVLIILLLVLLLGALPTWPYSRSWGYYPSGGLGAVLAILIILLLIGWL